MPFTPVHALVALPFARRPWSTLSSGGRTWALSALAVGAMAPDLPLFLDAAWPGAQEVAVHTHRWPFLPAVLATTLAVTALWVVRVRPPFLAALPRRSAGSMPSAQVVSSAQGVPSAQVATSAQAASGPRPASRARARDRARDRRIVEALVVVGMALLGILSHLFWDDFTHLRGAAVQTWSLLREPVLGHPVYVYLQHGSSLLGVLALMVVAGVWFRRAVPVAAPRRLRSLGVAIAAGAVVGMLGAAARLLHDDARVTVYSLARLAATFPVLGAAVGLTIWALVLGMPARDVSTERSGSGQGGRLWDT